MNKFYYRVPTKAFMEENDSFLLDKQIESKLVLSAARGGYLRKVR